MQTVVPERATRLFTWRELERLVCGSTTIDFSLWQRHTTYQGGFSSEHATIVLFWAVMKSFSVEEQSGFIRFAWGRNRLPPEREWKTSMFFKLSRMPGVRADEIHTALPVSHTCFNHVE